MGWIRIGVGGVVLLLFCLAAVFPARGEEIEIRDYQGERLDPFYRKYDNSIKGPQKVDPETYRLEIVGEVDHPQSLTYRQVLDFPGVKKAITLHCVEGWSERLLFEGVRLMDLLNPAGPKKGVKTVIFHAADGYTSSLEYEFVKDRNLILAARINGLALDDLRGFPFQVVAEGKYGYKWVKWVKKIEISYKGYKGFWETRGYDNKADLPR